MVWAGDPFAHLVEFSTGVPTGTLVYSLTDDTGTVLDTQTITVGTGDVSHLILIDGSHNTISRLYAGRTLAWHYTTATALVSDRISYRVDSIIPYAVSTDGVRSKMGLSADELSDDLLDMLLAYSDLGLLLDYTMVTPGTRSGLLVGHAIEAQAALRCLPVLQLTVASRESSGTNSFQRYDAIDWEEMQGHLYSYIARAQNELVLNPDPTVGKFLFGAITRANDAVTGNAN